MGRVVDFHINEQNPVFVYPGPWLFKVIGTDGETVVQAVADVVRKEQYWIEHSQDSREGKYCAYNVKVIVYSVENRNAIFESLKQHEDIIMVL
jgi:putative lipoic acid-binding regulatory protein